MLNDSFSCYNHKVALHSVAHQKLQSRGACSFNYVELYLNGPKGIYEFRDDYSITIAPLQTMSQTT